MNSSQQRRMGPDWGLAELAEDQHAVATITQMRALGLTTGDVQYRLMVGRLHVVHRGVYAIGHPDITIEGRFLAAVLAVGRGAVLSHRSAAVLWGFAPNAWAAANEVDVAVPRRLKQRKGLRIHFLAALDQRDWTRRHRIPVTMAPRTLIDLAMTESDRTLKRLLGQAQVERRVSVPQLRAEAAATRGRGAKRILALTAAGPAPTRSGLEDRFLERCHGRGVRPRTNARVEGVEVDFLFPEQRLIVETDGGLYHASEVQQEADRAKQARLEAAGYRVLRIGDEQIEGETTIQRIEAAIMARP